MKAPVDLQTVSNPWMTGSLAALELVLGFILLAFPYMLGLSAAWVGGLVLIAAGVLRVVYAMRHIDNRVWNMLAGVVYLLLGTFTALMPVLSVQVWTLLLGMALLVGGGMRLLVAVGLVYQPGSFWRFLGALVTLVLGAMVTWGWPADSLWLIGTLVAVERIFSGWTLLFLTLTPNRPYAV